MVRRVFSAQRSRFLLCVARHASFVVSFAACLLAGRTARAQSCATSVASVDNNGVQGGDASVGYRNCFSADGRWIVFYTGSKLVPADTDLIDDVYVRDRVLGTTELVSVSSSGAKGIYDSVPGDISPDGRFVTFVSSATNLVAVDLNGWDDVFLHDRWTGTTTMVSVGDVGQQGNLHSYGGSMSADGRFIAFWSASTNLVPNDTNGIDDVFVFDATTGTSTCVSRDGGVMVGGAGPMLSQDARYICFGSAHVFPGCGALGYGGFVRMDLWTGAVDCLNLRPDGTPSSNAVGVGGISADGRYLAFESIAPDLVLGDTNNKIDVFVRDMVLGKTERVSVATGGSQANSDSETCRISANGRFVAFETSASNLYPGGTFGWRIAVRDRWKNTTTLVSQNNAGVKANAQCLRPTISPDGTCVAFDSDADNLIDGGDMNGLFVSDVIVRECTPSPAFTYCVSKQSSIGCIPAIVQTGGPSSTASSGFDVQALGVINHRNGILTYGLSGQALTTFAGGYLCVQPPLKRLPPQNSGGTSGPTWDCTGVFHFDFNTWIHGSNDPALVAGATVWAQWWYRDSGFPVPNNVGLTDAIEFVIQ